MKVRRFLSTIGPFTLLFLCVWIGYLSFSGVSSLYILADGYRGEFQIQAHQPDGVPLRKINGSYVFEVPASGILKIRGSNPILGKWERSKARYQSDQTPIITDGTERPGDVAFRGGWADNQGTFGQFVGTEADLQANKLRRSAREF